MFKHKNLAKIITHKYTLYFMYFLALLNGVNYFKKQKIYCALIAIAFFLLSNKFLTKNKALSIFYSLFLSNFVLGCGKIIEGMGKKERVDPRSQSELKAWFRGFEKGNKNPIRSDGQNLPTKPSSKQNTIKRFPIKATVYTPGNKGLEIEPSLKNAQAAAPTTKALGKGQAVEEPVEEQEEPAEPAQQSRGQAQQAPGQQQQQQQQRQQKQGGPGVSPVAHRQQQPTHTHNKQVVLITASAVASALALIVATGAIFLVNKKKF